MKFLTFQVLVIVDSDMEKEGGNYHYQIVRRVNGEKEMHEAGAPMNVL